MYLLKRDLGCLLTREAATDVQQLHVVPDVRRLVEHTASDSNRLGEGSGVVAAATHVKAADRNPTACHWITIAQAYLLLHGYIIIITVRHSTKL